VELALAHLDDFQTWLSTSATANSASSSRSSTASTFVDNLVMWFTTVLLWHDVARDGRAAGRSVCSASGRARGDLVVARSRPRALGLWEESVQTLALMLAAVSLSLRVGSRSASRPAAGPIPAPDHAVLDAMQIVPAFAYLMPVVILFPSVRRPRSSRR
jgi:ABC-type proline/glycine betaine transport system permease subunit